MGALRAIDRIPEHSSTLPCLTKVCLALLALGPQVTQQLYDLLTTNRLDVGRAGLMGALTAHQGLMGALTAHQGLMGALTAHQGLMGALTAHQGPTSTLPCLTNPKK
jgi:hypothetical protein